jgi:hypothetical protein
MNIKLHLVGFSVFFINICFAQQESIDSNHNSLKKNLFTKGIYMEDSKLLIPWGVSFIEISKYNSPEITCATKTSTRIRWKSVLILDSTAIDFWCFYFRCFSRKKPTGKFNTMYGSIDSAHINKLKNYFEKYTHIPGELTEGKNTYYYYWIIDDCNVKLGYDAFYKAHIWIQKR